MLKSQWITSLSLHMEPWQKVNKEELKIETNQHRKSSLLCKGKLVICGENVYGVDNMVSLM